MLCILPTFRPRSLAATRGAPVLSRSLEATQEAPFVVRLLGLHLPSLPRARPQSLFLGPLGVRNWGIRQLTRAQKRGGERLTRPLSWNRRHICCCGGLYHRCQFLGSQFNCGDRLSDAAGNYCAHSRGRRLVRSGWLTVIIEVVGRVTIGGEGAASC